MRRRGLSCAHFLASNLRSTVFGCQYIIDTMYDVSRHGAKIRRWCRGPGRVEQGGLDLGRVVLHAELLYKEEQLLAGVDAHGRISMRQKGYQVRSSVRHGARHLACMHADAHGGEDARHTMHLFDMMSRETHETRQKGHIEAHVPIQ